MSDPRSRVARTEWTLPFEPPYDWEALILFLSARAVPGLEVAEPGRYLRTFSLAGESGAFEVRPGVGNQLRVTIWYSDPDLCPEILRRVGQICGTDQHVGKVLTHFAADPVLGPLVRQRPGLRIPGAWDPFEVAVRAMAGQQISVQAATSLVGRIVRLFGQRVSWPDGEPELAQLTRVFPSAAEMGGRDLFEAGMPQARLAALENMASTAAGDSSLFEPSPTRLRRLTSLPGLGDWTVQYIAMRAFRDPDAFPAADVVLRRVFGGGPQSRVTVSTLLKLAERWRPYRAFAVMHVWIGEADAARRKVKVRAAGA